MILLVLLCSFVFAFEKPQCIPPSYLVDFTSPISGERMLFCQKKTSAGLKKDGDEIIYSKEMKIIKRNIYSNGKRIIKKLASNMPSKKTENTKGIVAIATIPWAPVDTWSQNGGQLSSGDLGVACGCTLDADGSVYCWGESCGFEEKRNLIDSFPGAQEIVFTRMKDKNQVFYFPLSCVTGKQTTCWFLDKYNEVFNEEIKKLLQGGEVVFIGRKGKFVFYEFKKRVGTVRDTWGGHEELCFCNDDSECRYLVTKKTEKGADKKIEFYVQTYNFSKSCKKLEYGLMEWNLFLSVDGEFSKMRLKENSLSIDHMLLEKDVRDFTLIHARAYYCILKGKKGILCKDDKEISHEVFPDIPKEIQEIIGLQSRCFLTKKGKVYCSNYQHPRKSSKLIEIEVPQAKLLYGGPPYCIVTKEKNDIYCWGHSTSQVKKFSYFSKPVQVE